MSNLCRAFAITVAAFTLGNVSIAQEPVVRPATEDQYVYLTTEKLTSDDQKALVEARRSVWEAWFRGDQAAIERLMPAESVVADPHDSTWADRREIVRRAVEFAKTGGKLTELRFPHNRIQIYGPVAVLLIDYELSFEMNGEATSMSGRATEVFVRRDEGWLNTAWHLDTSE